MSPSTATHDGAVEHDVGGRLRSRTFSRTVVHMVAHGGGVGLTRRRRGCGGGRRAAGAGGAGGATARGRRRRSAAAGGAEPAPRRGPAPGGPLRHGIGCGRLGAWLLRVNCLLGRPGRPRLACGCLTGRDRDVHPRLDALDPLQQSRFGVAGRRQQQPRAHHLEQQPRCGGAAHLAETGVHHLGVAGQGRGAEPRRLVAHPFEHVVGRVDHTARRGVGHGLQHDQVAEPLQQVGGEAARVVARVDQRLDGAEQRRGVAGGQRVDRGVDQRQVGGAEQRQRPRVVDAVAVGARRAAGRAPTACRGASRRRRGSPAGTPRRRRRRPPARRCVRAVRAWSSAPAAGTGSGGCATGWWAGPSRAPSSRTRRSGARAAPRRSSAAR